MDGLTDLKDDALTGVVDALAAQGLADVVLGENAITLGLAGGSHAIADLREAALRGLQMDHESIRRRLICLSTASGRFRETGQEGNGG